MRNDDDGDEGADEPFYAYKPSLMGAPWELRLKPDGLGYRVGRYAGLVRYDQVKRVRLSFRPMTMQQNRFIAEVWSDVAPKIQIASVSWRSLVEQRRQDADYLAFISELHRRLANAGSKAVFQAGTPHVLYWTGMLVFVTASLAFAALVVRAVQVGEWAGTALISFFLAMFVWQVGGYLRRNKPRTYRPDALPPEPLPDREV